MLFFTIWRAKRRIRKLARQRCINSTVFSFGATHIDPAHLAIWITTTTDRERELFKADTDLEITFRAVLSDLGYPSSAVPHVGFEFESQETVDRDYGGNWWDAVR